MSAAEHQELKKMPDIVVRLRDNNPSLPTRDRFEAATEIEKLRERVSQLERTYINLTIN